MKLEKENNDKNPNFSLDENGTRLLLKMNMFLYFAYKLSLIGKTFDTNGNLYFHYVKIKEILFIVIKHQAENNDLALANFFDKFGIWLQDPIEADLYKMRNNIDSTINRYYNIYTFPKEIDKCDFSKLDEKYKKVIDMSINSFTCNRIKDFLKMDAGDLYDYILTMNICKIGKEISGIDNTVYYFNRENLIKIK
jgi:hypothetical protein